IMAPPYLVMERMGRSLRDQLREMLRLDPDHVARIGLQIAEALAVAHARNLIHGDVKPGNILFEPDEDRVKLSDFGLARKVRLPAEISQETEAFGTPEFMSPEQLLTPDRADGRADLYGLGATLYESLTGELPFRGVHLPKLVLQILSTDPMP